MGLYGLGLGYHESGFNGLIIVKQGDHRFQLVEELLVLYIGNRSLKMV